MWRLASSRVSLLAGRCSRKFPQQYCLNLVGCSEIDNGRFALGGATATASRFFSRRRGRGDVDPDEEALEFGVLADPGKQQVTPLSAADMELYNLLSEDFDAAGDEEEEEEGRNNAEFRRKQQEIQQELDSRTGRPWTDPWEITEEQWMSTTTADDLPDWSPEYVSRISQERIRIHPDGVPTLGTLAGMSFPTACPHPGLGQAKEYAVYRKRIHYQDVAKKVEEMAQSRVEKILALSSWDDKQDAVDDLFEDIEMELKKKETILGLHPEFGKWVGLALEEYLKRVSKGISGTISNDSTSGLKFDDDNVHPVFMDCFSDKEPDAVVPSILSPLKPHHRDGPGRMVEEWQLSAHKKTKRILLRQCTQAIAETLENNVRSRIFVHGRKGVGKSALLASIVASARKSGYIVLYLPDGDRLRKNGYFVTPNALREGMFDLQNLSQEACANLLASHGDDLNGMQADKMTIESYFKDSQLQRITNYSGESMSLVDLLKYAQERKIHAPMCYSVIVETLMNQDQKPFLIVLDDFNGYYDRGHYFHMSYDEDVRKPIPYDKINLFEHALGAMSLSTDDDSLATPKQLQRGAILVAVTESHAVPRKLTDGLIACAERQSAQEVSPSDAKLHVVEVPQFSDIEVDHILANFEATGIGKLRLDRGETVMNEQEVAYLKMVSGSVGQKLLDAAML